LKYAQQKKPNAIAEGLLSSSGAERREVKHFEEDLKNILEKDA